MRWVCGACHAVQLGLCFMPHIANCQIMGSGSARSIGSETKRSSLKRLSITDPLTDTL